MTSAPRSASSIAQKGPASTRERSRTRTPSRDRGGAVMAPSLAELPDPDHVQVDPRRHMPLAGLGRNEAQPVAHLLLEDERGGQMHRVEGPQRLLTDQGLGPAEDERCEPDQLPTSSIGGHLRYDPFEL